MPIAATVSSARCYFLRGIPVHKYLNFVLRSLQVLISTTLKPPCESFKDKRIATELWMSAWIHTRGVFALAKAELMSWHRLFARSVSLRILFAAAPGR